MWFLFCHDIFMIIRPISVVRQIGKSVKLQIIFHSTENMSKGLFLRPDHVYDWTEKRSNFIAYNCILLYHIILHNFTPK